MRSPDVIVNVSHCYRIDYTVNRYDPRADRNAPDYPWVRVPTAGVVIARDFEEAARLFSDQIALDPSSFAVRSIADLGTVIAFPIQEEPTV